MNIRDFEQSSRAAQPASVSPFSIDIHYYQLTIEIVLNNGTPEAPENEFVRQVLFSTLLIVGMNQSRRDPLMKRHDNGNQPQQSLATGFSYRISYYLVCTGPFLRSKAASKRASSCWSIHTIYWTYHWTSSTWHPLLSDHQR